MTSNGAGKLVVVSALTTVGTVSLSHMTKGEMPPVRSLIGAGITFTALAALSDPAPSLAGALAGTIMFTAVMLYGVPLMDSYFTHTDSRTQKKKNK